MQSPSTQNWPTYVTAGPFLFFSGQVGTNATTLEPCSTFEEVAGIEAAPTDVASWVNRMEAPVGAQAISIYERYSSLFRAQGGELRNLARYHIYQRDKRFFPVFDRIRRKYESTPPASTAVGVGRFDARDRARLYIDAIAVNPAAEKTLGFREVRGGAKSHTTAAFFSHVVGAGPYLFLAGQIPIDTASPGAPLIRNYDDVPEAGRFLKVGRSHEDTRDGPIAAQTWFTYDLIRQHLEAAGSSMDQVLNLIVYLQDIRDFPTFHRVHERFFGTAAPALTVIEVGEVGHKGTLIEIEPTAVIATGPQRTYHNPAGWQAPAVMSGIVEAGGLAFMSGIVGVDERQQAITSAESVPAEMRDAAARTSDVAALQSFACVSELRRRLAAAGYGAERIVHVTIYLADIESLPTVETILAGAFGASRPALAALEVSKPSPVSGTVVSLTAICWFGEETPTAAAA